MPSARPFPGGIADAQGQRAALRDRDGRLVAVALDAGTLLWRSAEPLQPLLLPPGEVIACTRGPQPACVALAWSGDQAGQAVWTSQPIELPGLPGGQDADLRLAAEADDAGAITLHWQAATRYRGGAAPGPAVLAASRRDAGGAVRVDRHTGRVWPVTPAPTRSQDEVAAPSDASAQAIAAADIGTRRYELCVLDQPDGTLRTVLRAHEREADRPLWELPIDALPRTRPRALRP